MKVIAVMGFLGSGKTSSILSLARYLTAEEGKKVAILVNEAGEIPIDGAVLTAGGNQVKEIFAGCICLMADDLVAAMVELGQIPNLDFIVVEPSGKANALRLTYLLSQLGFSPVGRPPLPGCTLHRRVTVVDGVRFDLLLRAARFLVAGAVEVADVVLVNKIDLLDEKTLASIIQRVQQLNPRAQILATSAVRGIPGSIWQAVVGEGNGV
jgi:G3E family GTPase